MTFPAKHFTREEFECKCGCGFDTVDAELLDVLEEVRVWFEEPVTINSGCRCVTHNENEGGKPNSQHLYGRAADIVVRNVPASEVYEYLNVRFPDDYGMKAYSTFTHIDTRTNRGRW